MFKQFLLLRLQVAVRCEQANTWIVAALWKHVQEARNLTRNTTDACQFVRVSVSFRLFFDGMCFVTSLFVCDYVHGEGAVAMGFTNVPFGIDGGSLLKRLKKFENLDLVVAMGPLGAQTGSVNVKPLPEQAARSTPLDQDTKSLVASDLFSVLYGGGISKCLACRSCPPTREGSGAWEGWHLPAFALFEIERPKV